MFRKTKIQLVLLFTLVFFLILSILGISLYLYMHKVSFNTIDDKLRHKERFLLHNTNDEFTDENERESERKVSYLFWGKDGKILFSDPKNAFFKNEISSLTPKIKDKKIRTQTVNGHSYRILTHPIQGHELKSYPAAGYVQLVYNIDPEVSVLQKLLILIGVGCAFGLLLSFFVGLFLANRALIPIERSWEKQAQFVGDASHELRTPLAVIQTHIELLFRHPANTIEQESTTIFKGLAEVKRLSRLVEDLLTLARADSNEQLINPELFLIDGLLRNIVEQFEPIADIKGIKIEKDIEDNILYFGDKARIHQLVVILLDNALKYTKPNGQLLITSKKDGSGLRINIEDTGSGIPVKDLPFIFDRFYRSDKDRTKETGGTGLGLSIAKWIAEAHGGQISAESRLNEGSRFTIKLPIKNHLPKLT
ncbi:sensor histidine kinase [Neobacillus terrae]|uniref:sensor histidine kinase n=1 Tax=Neobacillus terrae TaxID=3034837 RepID=UPI00140AA422|nr:HAMP domain-containing sensor histidine kinase [Neobacillus terrae]NHM33080.1 HAMP domain-containing histidine kinase [Neobacillus terrae]